VGAKMRPNPGVENGRSVLSEHVMAGG
jgi:hypothetical protein